MPWVQNKTKQIFIGLKNISAFFFTYETDTYTNNFTNC